MMILKRLIMKNKYLDKVVFEIYLDKKPYEMFLELLMEYFFKYDFTENSFYELKHDSALIEKEINNIEIKYGIILQSYSLKIWLDKEFILKDRKIILHKYFDLTLNEIEDNIIKKNKTKEQEFQNKIANLINKFQIYAKNNDLNLKREEIKDIFFKYDYTTYTPYDDICEYQDESFDIVELNNKKNLLFHNFVNELINNKEDEYLKILEDCGIANQFANMIFSGDMFNNDIFDGTVFYIDTPIILKYLGYAGKKIQDSYNSFINSIKNCNGSIKVFSHIVEEMNAIIYTLQLRITQGFFNAPNVNEFLQARKEDKSLPLTYEEIVNLINKYNIDIDDFSYIDENKSHEFNMKNILIDEDNLRDFILSEYKFDKNKYKYLLDNRVNVDIKSTSFISIKRNRNKETCFLLTQNNAFKKAVKKYHDYNSEYLDYNSNEIITENDIIFNLWQNIGNNFNSNFRTFFRLKCFSYLKIDDRFKEDFYIKSKRLYEQSNKNKVGNVDSILANNPNFLYLAYNRKIIYNDDVYKTFKELVDSKIKELEEKAVEKTLRENEKKVDQTIEKITNENDKKITMAIENTKEFYENEINNIFEEKDSIEKEYQNSISKLENEIKNIKLKNYKYKRNVNIFICYLIAIIVPVICFLLSNSFKFKMSTLILFILSACSISIAIIYSIILIKKKNN